VVGVGGAVLVWSTDDWAAVVVRVMPASPDRAGVEQADAALDGVALSEVGDGHAQPVPDVPDVPSPIVMVPMAATWSALVLD
jgi:hypothetical protein